MTWTIFHSDSPQERTAGLSLSAAADHLLSEDGHRWEVRLDDGRVTLWRTRSSVNAIGGCGPLVQLAPWSFFESKDEAFQWVVDQDDWCGLEAQPGE